ncbi:hypothetical protein, partial [Ferrovum myxofaciens]|uniref:hypothetical protein n=1 Tax=Ferrovum myxofaciens TaxID=416213 RepID=UPI001F2F5360
MQNFSTVCRSLNFRHSRVFPNTEGTHLRDKYFQKMQKTLDMKSDFRGRCATRSGLFLKRVAQRPMK